MSAPSTSATPFALTSRLVATLGLAAAVVLGASCKTTVSEVRDPKIAAKPSGSILDGRLERLEEEAEKYPKRHELQYRIAGVHFEQGRFKESIVHLEQAIALDTEGLQSKYWYHLGRAYLASGEKELAASAFEKAIQRMKAGRYSGAHAALGFVCAMRKDYAGAEEQFRECVKIEPRNPEFYYHLGCVCDLQGKREDAIHNFREYLLRGGRAYRDKAVFYLERLGVEVERDVLQGIPRKARG